MSGEDAEDEGGSNDTLKAREFSTWGIFHYFFCKIKKSKEAIVSLFWSQYFTAALVKPFAYPQLLG